MRKLGRRKDSSLPLLRRIREQVDAWHHQRRLYIYCKTSEIYCSSLTIFAIAVLLSLTSVFFLPSHRGGT